MNLCRIILLCLVSLTGIHFHSLGQASVVPVNHQVYEWLHYQRVLGRIPAYNYEALPLRRGQIVKFLKEIKSSESQVNSIDQKLLHAYLREFTLEHLETYSDNTLFQGKKENIKEGAKNKSKLFFSNSEPHAFVHIGKAGTVAADVVYSTGYIQTKTPETSSSAFNIKGFRTYATVYDKFGIHLEGYNAFFNDFKNIIQYEPTWRNTWRAKKGNGGGALYAQGFVSFTTGNLGIDIGRGAIRYGMGINEPLVVRRNAADFDFIRLNYDAKHYKYTFLHGQLQDFILRPGRDTLTTSGGGSYLFRQIPTRWFSMRKLQIQPWHWLQFGFTETVMYSVREASFSYLNPILPITVSEFNNQDRDNPILYFDGLLRPVKGLELFGSIGIDDMKKISDVFKKTGNRSSGDGVFTYQIGGKYAYKTGTQVGIEYIQIDPYFYTHWQELNTFDNFDTPLGHPNGPNSDQITISVRQWLPKRSWINVKFSRNRKGLNPISQGQDGQTITENIGGNIYLAQSSGTPIFLDGNVQTWNQIQINAGFEPWRGISVLLDYETGKFNQHERLIDFDYFSARVVFGY